MSVCDELGLQCFRYLQHLKKLMGPCTQHVLSEGLSRWISDAGRIFRNRIYEVNKTLIKTCQQRCADARSEVVGNVLVPRSSIKQHFVADIFLSCLPEAQGWWNSQWWEVPGTEVVCQCRSPCLHNACQVISLSWQDLSNESVCKLHWQCSQGKIKYINIQSSNLPRDMPQVNILMECLFFSLKCFADELKWL